MIASTFIVEQECRAAIGGDQQIGAAVIVDISVSRAACDSGGGESGSHRRRFIVEFAATQIMKQMRRLPVGNPLLNALDIRIEMTIGDEQIWPAIEIVIEEDAAESQREQAGTADFGTD